MKIDINSFLREASKLRIAVVGDLILDRYIFGEVTRISPEAPVQILKITGTRENPGGAGNVVENLKGLGCEVSSFYGEGTPIKTRIMAGDHHLLRMDDEDAPKWMHWDDMNDIGLGYGVKSGKYNCVVISDYGKGTISSEVAVELINLCVENDVPIVVDSKQKLGMFTGATIVKCNIKEWAAQGIIGPFGWMKDHAIPNLIVTEGDKGMEYYGHDGSLELSGYVPGLKTEICDVCGAGDTVTAILGICQAIGMTISAACELANIAASEVCRHPGVHSITKEELIRRFNEVQL